MAAWTDRLVPLLGVAPRDVTRAHLQALVDGGVREDVDLDFKEDLYGKSDGDKREMAADIAALANERGGVLILGVKDEEGVAVGLPGVELNEAEALRIRQTATGLLAPHVPFDVLLVADDENAGQGFYLIAIPPSAWRPHAVRKDNDLRYPRRDGTTKRWMSESEVAVRTMACAGPGAMA
jgi:predicted HTH transcriptional regulator